MRLFLLFSTLATATALTAKEALADLWTHWLAGASDKYQGYYADEVTVFIDPDMARGGSPKSGAHTLSEDFTITNILDQFAAAYPAVHEVNYEIFEKDANHVVCDCHFVAKSVHDGNNHWIDFIIKLDTDSNGKVYNHEWHLYRTEALDAHSVLDRTYADWAKGIPATFVSSLANEFDFSVSGVTGAQSEINGRYTNTADLFAAMAKAPYTYDLSTFKYNLHPGSPDGKSVSAELSMVEVYPNGARFKVYSYQTWTVDSFGKIVSGASTLQRKVPLNARASWDAMIELFGAGDLDGVMAKWAPDMTITFGGDVAGMRKYWPADFFQKFGGKTVTRDDYASNYVDAMTKMPIKSIEFEFLSQSDDYLLIRFNSVQTMNGQDIASAADWNFGFKDGQMTSGVGNFLWHKLAGQHKEGL